MGTALHAGVRETLEPTCPCRRPLMACRRDIRQDQRCVACRCTCLQTDEASRKFLEERHNVRSPQPLLSDDVSLPVNAMDLEYILRQILSSGDDFAHLPLLC